MEDSKPCAKCGVSKRLTEFHRDRTQKDGFKKVCKSCRNTGSKQPDQPVEPTVTANDYMEMLSEARQKALKHLVNNHVDEFKALVVHYKKKLGVKPTWVSLARI